MQQRHNYLILRELLHNYNLPVSVHVRVPRAVANPAPISHPTRGVEATAVAATGPQPRRHEQGGAQRYCARRQR